MPLGGFEPTLHFIPAIKAHLLPHFIFRASTTNDGQYRGSKNDSFFTRWLPGAVSVSPFETKKSNLAIRNREVCFRRADFCSFSFPGSARGAKCIKMQIYRSACSETRPQSPFLGCHSLNIHAAFLGIRMSRAVNIWATILLLLVFGSLSRFTTGGETKERKNFSFEFPLEKKMPHFSVF